MFGVVAELNTWPHILSTQTTGVPDWVVGSLVLVAQGMVIQSVEQEVPTTLPRVGEPPVMENAWGGVLAESAQAVYWIPQKFLSILTHIV